jgi:hypothetical protein
MVALKRFDSLVVVRAVTSLMRVDLPDILQETNGSIGYVFAHIQIRNFQSKRFSATKNE